MILLLTIFICASTHPLSVGQYGLQVTASIPRERHKQSKVLLIVPPYNDGVITAPLKLSTTMVLVTPPNDLNISIKAGITSSSFCELIALASNLLDAGRANPMTVACF